MTSWDDDTRTEIGCGYAIWIFGLTTGLVLVGVLGLLMLTAVDWLRH